jgi:hypothetical protein
VGLERNATGRIGPPDGRAVSVHFYMEPVEEAGPGPLDAVQMIVTGAAASGMAASR